MVKLASMMRQERGPDRFTTARVELLVSPANPDYARIHRMAAQGVQVRVGPGFRPSGIEYQDSGGAVDRMIYEACLSSNLAVALPISTLESCLEVRVRTLTLKRADGM